MKNVTFRLLSIFAIINVIVAIASCNLSGSNTSTEPIIDVSITSSETTIASSATETESVATTTTETSSVPETTTEDTFLEQNVFESETVPETAGNASTPSPEWVTNLPQAKDSGTKQMLIVAASGMSKTTCKVSMHERDSEGNWIQILSVNGYVGKKGMVLDADRKEGCGKTPIGVYRFNAAFGIANDPGCAIPYTKVNNNLYWSGDMREGMHYNEMVNIKDVPNLDKKSSEHLIEYTKSYQYCLNISFNEECTIGRGSAIFLHCYGNNKYTAGCVAIPKDAMVKVMKRVSPDCVVIIDTADNLKK